MNLLTSHLHLRRRSWLCAFSCAVCAISAAAGESKTDPQHPQSTAQNTPTALASTTVTAQLTGPGLPPLPTGVSELKFSDFFVQPVGSRGLKLTETLRRLDGKRVRILGYMARQEQPIPGMFLFNAIPVRLNEDHYGLADDLPAATLFVTMPKDRDKVVRHTPEMMLLTGTLSVGNREEADGRISTVRLALDPPEAGGKQEANKGEFK